MDNVGQAPMESKYKIKVNVKINGSVHFALLDTYRHQNHEIEEIEIDINEMPDEYKKFFAKYLLSV